MPIFLLKSLLSLMLLFLTFVQMFTMFEIFEKTGKKYNSEKLRKIHKLNAKLYFLLYIFIAYLYLDFILKARSESSPRASFHGIFAIVIVVLLGFKISFVMSGINMI